MRITECCSRESSTKIGEKNESWMDIQPFLNRIFTFLIGIKISNFLKLFSVFWLLVAFKNCRNINLENDNLVLDECFKLNKRKRKVMLWFVYKLSVLYYIKIWWKDLRNERDLSKRKCSLINWMLFNKYFQNFELFLPFIQVCWTDTMTPY